MRQILLGVILLLLVCRSVVAQATTYYISPTGSDSNNGLSSGTPFLTFAHALDPSRASCGDTLNLLDGTYGDGTSTGKISLVGKICASTAPLTIRALNQRQARINDNGTGVAIQLTSSTAYIIFDGIVANSTNNSAEMTGNGRPFRALSTNHITIKNSLFLNPNKYGNAAVVIFEQSSDALVEDTEVYDFHRHAIGFVTSQRMVARRVYGHPRTGVISGGYPPGETPGTADALVSFYPCFNCVLENGIAEGAMYLTEMNATYNQSILMKDTKILGSICLNCSDGNGIFPQGRDVVDLNHSPQNITIEHNALVGFSSLNDGIKNQDGVNMVINRNTIIGTGSSGPGIETRDGANVGVSAAQMSFTMTRNIVVNRGGTGFLNTHTPGSWSGDHNWSFNNGTAFNAALRSNWGANSTTADPQLGNCKVWAPDGSAAKVAGAGANILYRYNNGVLTNVPLWDPTTGEFPHGSIVAGVNDVAGKSLFDVHKRLNVNTNGCSFPANYGQASTDAQAPEAPRNLTLF